MVEKIHCALRLKVLDHQVQWDEICNYLFYFSALFPYLWV